jgi:hypothetical protein
VSNRTLFFVWLALVAVAILAILFAKEAVKDSAYGFLGLLAGVGLVGWLFTRPRRED